MAEWLGTALQKLLQRFESASDLTKSALQVIVAHFFYYQSGVQKPIGAPRTAPPKKNKESHLAATLPQYPANVAYVMQDIVFQRHAPRAYRYFPTLLAMNKLCALSITDNTPNGN